MDKFTDLLDEYLDERDRQNNGYYDNRYIGESMEGRKTMQALAEQMDAMISAIQTEK